MREMLIEKIYFTSSTRLSSKVGCLIFQLEFFLKKNDIDIFDLFYYIDNR